MKSTLGRIGYFILLLFIIAFAKIMGKSLVNGALNKSTKLTYSDSLKFYLDAFPRIEDSINQHPRKLDDLTSLDSINCSSENNEITYYHTLIQNSKNDFDLDIFNSVMQNHIDSSLLNNPKMAQQRRFKTKLNYVYFDKDGDFVSKISKGN